MIIYPFGTIQLYGQDYLNIKYADGSYKYSLVSEVSEITFNAGGTEMTITKTDASSITDTLSTVSEMTFDASILGGGSPLPVELVSFTAELNKNDVLLLWTTATEVNNYGFEIERAHLRSKEGNYAGVNSSVAGASWERLGFVEGHGNSNSPKNYSFVDSKPLSGKTIYRLKQINIDGVFKYSKEIEVEVGILGKYMLGQNFPNPFNPTTNINFSIPVTGYVKLTIYNTLGQKIATLVNGIREAGTHNISFNGSNLESGIYFYKLESGNFVQVQKMILLK